MKISVIIPTYQHAKTILDCVESLVTQSRSPDEIIVVDDGSTDGTEQVLTDSKDQIQYIRQENAGPQSARMAGYKKSSGDLLLFCDADIVARANMLERLENALKTHSEASYAYASFMWGSKLFKCGPFNADRLKRMNFIHTSALIRREHFPGFDLSIKKFQDWDLWLTMLEQEHKGVFVNEILYTIRQERSRLNISSWLPSFAYKIPWRLIGWKPKRIQKYEEAREVIRKKHHL